MPKANFGARFEVLYVGLYAPGPGEVSLPFCSPLSGFCILTYGGLGLNLSKLLTLYSAGLGDIPDFFEIPFLPLQYDKDLLKF